MYSELSFRQIKATGRVKQYLGTQAPGLTGKLGSIGHPFTLPSWDVTREQAEQPGAFHRRLALRQRFLGAI